MCLADYCHDDGKDWHSIPSIQDWTCLGRTAVIDSLRWLEAQALIVREKVSGQNATTFLQLAAIEAYPSRGHQSAKRTSPDVGTARHADPTSPPDGPPPIRHADPTSPPDGPEASVSIREASEKHQSKHQDRTSPIQGIPPKAGTRSRNARASEVTLAEWLQAENDAGRKAVPADDSIFSYASKVGLPLDLLHLAWAEFKARYTAEPTKGQRPKTYTDWRAVFRKSVKEGWLKLWYLEGQQYLLTTAGLMAQRAHQAPGEAIPQATIGGRRPSAVERRISNLDALCGRDRQQASRQRAQMGDFVDVDSRPVTPAEAVDTERSLRRAQPELANHEPLPWEDN